MLLTVGVVQIDTLQRFIVADYDKDSSQYGGRDSVIAIAAKELEVNFSQLAEFINVNFHGVQGENGYAYHDEIYFYDIKNAIRAKEWLEGQLVAKKLMGKSKRNRIIYGHTHKKVI